MLTWCLAVLGEFAEGIARAEEGLRIAEMANQPWELITACFSVGNVYLNKGDLHKAIPVLERGLGLCQVWNISVWFPATAADLAYAYTLSGRVAEALPLLEQAVERAVSMKLLYSHALWLAWLSEAYWRAGRLEDALEFARRTLDLSRDRQEQGSWYGPSASSVRSPRSVIPWRSSRRKTITVRLSPWLRSLACARSRPTVASASAPCIPR